MLRPLLASLLLFVAPAAAQEIEDLPPVEDPDSPVSSGGGLDAEGYLVLSADQDAQASIGGFRRYLERVRPEDGALYALLDPPLADLERRERAANIVFGVGGTLGIGASLASIAVFSEVGDEAGWATLGAGLGVLAVTVVIQAILRPSFSELAALIDRHDRALGRR
jgi:hypothetical protein